MHARHWIALATLLPLAPLPATAQSSTGELRDDPADHRVAGEFGFFYRREGETDVALFQPSVYGTITAVHVDDELSLQIDVAWRFIGIAGDVGAFVPNLSAFRAMNPFVGGRVAFRRAIEGGAWRLRGGIGFTLPLTNAYDDFRTGGGSSFSGLLAQVFAPGMQAVYDTWLQTPLNAAVVFRGDFEYRAEYFIVGVDTAFAALLPVEYDGRTGDSVLILQLGGFVGGRPIPELAVGVRLQAVAAVTTRDTMGASNTEGYTSLIPFVRGEFGPGFVEGRLLMNLDDPWGFAFESGSASASAPLRVWAIQVSGGATF